jgi:hypothetical protein
MQLDNNFKLTIDLTLEEVQFILNVFGDMPAKSGVWPLIVKIKDQADSQLPTIPQPTDNGQVQQNKSPKPSKMN